MATQCDQSISGTVNETDSPPAVAVYCGSHGGKSSVFAEKVAELGSYLATKKIRVVYGGSGFGLLGTLASSVLDNGGQLTGIIPEFFRSYQGYTAPGEEVLVPDMHTRKKMMFDTVQAFIALPGGVGTMEELTEILTWYKLKLHTKPVALLNVDGYYDHFLKWLSRAIDEEFITHKGEVDDLMVISNDPKDLVDRLCIKWKNENSK